MLKELLDISTVQIYSQKIGISKIRKEIGEPGEILGQKILKEQMEDVNAHDCLFSQRLERINDAQKR